MRLSREVVAKRETRVKELLTENQNLTIKEINASLSAEFGGRKMAPGRIVALRKTLVSPLGVTESEASATNAPADAE